MASTPDPSSSLINLVQSLSHVITYADSSNVDTNRKLWDNYARDWVCPFPSSIPNLLQFPPLGTHSNLRFELILHTFESTDADWVVKMVQNLADTKNTAVSDYLHLLGEEWSDKLSFQQVLEDFFWPNLRETFVVAELGSGGGRVASRVVHHVKELHCYDISREMLKKAESAVNASLNVQGAAQVTTKFEYLQTPRFPSSATSQYDFVYAFDVFPHVDLHTQWRYYQEFARVLKPGARAIIHTANLEAPEGWDRFSQQDKYSVGGFYFMVPSMVLTLVAKAGLQVVSTSIDVKEVMGRERRSNIYYNRDFMVLVRKASLSSISDPLNEQPS